MVDLYDLVMVGMVVKGIHQSHCITLGFQNTYDIVKKIWAQTKMY